MQQPPGFLKTVLAHLSNPDHPSNRPHVTLTFAQSIDAKIAGENGQQLLLSGKESMVMTHWIRTMHDAILVGIGTALNDDPQLNVRHLPQPTTSAPYNLPRPVIIDTHLRLPTSCKLLRNFHSGIGRRPWIVCVNQLDDSEGNRDELIHKMTRKERKEALEKAGARIIEISASSIPDSRFPSSYLSVHAILKSLSDLGIRSLMVEGGARIIESFFAASEKIVDALIITVAPVLVGSHAIGYECKYPVLELSNSNKQARFTEVHTELVGRDTVLAFVYNKA